MLLGVFRVFRFLNETFCYYFFGCVLKNFQISSEALKSLQTLPTIRFGRYGRVPAQVCSPSWNTNTMGTFLSFGSVFAVNR